MQKSPAEVSTLIHKYLEGELSPDDRQALDTWLNEDPNNQLIFNKLIDPDNILKGVGDQLKINKISQDLFRRVWSGIDATEPAPVSRVRFLYRLRQASGDRRHRLRQASGDRRQRWGWIVAASVILALGVGIYFLNTNKKGTQPPAAAVTPVDIAPGKDGAILTLADGSKVVLDSLGNGVIATQNGARVVLKNGRLAYDLTGATAGEVMYNTMSTPKGRQFQIVLPDGTKVWLNAASSIRYPTVFAGKERKIDVSGEAYFEVAKNAGMPFRVNINNRAEVEVLGTHFNVNAYENEGSINTTLLEGSVRVMLVGQNLAQRSQWPQASNTQPGNDVVLQPGQQAQIADAIRVIPNADIEKAMAWRNGVFNFQGVSLEEAMRQLVRWYDIEVVYEKGIPNITFFGEMSRGMSLDGLIRTLEKTGVHFRIREGRRLVVTP